MNTVQDQLVVALKEARKHVPVHRVAALMVIDTALAKAGDSAPVSASATVPMVEICKAFDWRTDGNEAVLSSRIKHHIRDLKASIAAHKALREKDRDAALEEAANMVASTNTLGMTAPAAITKLCAAIRAIKGKSAPAAVPEGLGKAILAGLPHHMSKEERIAIKDRIINAFAAPAAVPQGVEAQKGGA